MSHNRRTFLTSTCLVACGGALATTLQKASAALSIRSTMLPSALPIEPAEQTVLAFANRYASEVRLIGRCVLAKLRGQAARTCHLLVSIGRLEALDAALAGVRPFANGYGSGNVLCFTLGGIEFTVENLTRESFGMRLDELQIRKKIVLAHDALSYDPETQSLSDPFGALRAREVVLTNRTVAGPAALDAVLRSVVEAAELGLDAAPNLKIWKRRVLALLTRAKDARSTTQTFLQQLVTVADKIPPASFAELLGSRSVSSALRQVFDLDAKAAITQFEALRPTIGGEVSNGALWLALLIAPEIESEPQDGAATTWLRRGSRFDVLRSRKALLTARTFLSTSGTRLN